MEDTRHLHIEFFNEAKEDVAATREHGVPKFKNEEFVRIQFVGDKNNKLVAPAQAMSFCPEQKMQMTYAERFPRHYEAFQANEEVPVDGVPLSELPGITASKIAEFAQSNVRTVEGLAGMDGTLLGKLGMGAREWKHKAEKWLANASTGAGEKALEENRVLKEQIAALTARVNGGKEKPATAMDVVAEGPFKGLDGKALKALYKAKTGDYVRGTPKLTTLIEMCTEAGCEPAQVAA